MIVDPEPLMIDLFCFLCEVDNIKNTLLEARIKEICGQGHKKHEVYKLKAGAGQLYRNVPLYTDKQIQEVKELSKSHLYYFDFVKKGDNSSANQYF